jgi:AcrR family transcriptional regulator
MTTPSRRVDRRMQRTRQALQQAFIEVAHEKGIVATTIQDITKRADVNRGTFYLHFADKYMLLVAIIHEHFQTLLTTTLSPESRWDRRSLQLFIQAVLEDFERKYRHLLLAPDVALLIERATCEELARLLLMWLKQDKRAENQKRVSLETLARLTSWTIFGAAVQWSQEEQALSSERMAHAVLLVITEGIAHLAPFALPE